MNVGIVRETRDSERRVALVPTGAAALKNSGLEVLIESGAGVRAGFTDNDYVQRGGTILHDAAEVFERSDVLLQVRTPGANPLRGRQQIEWMRPGQALIGFADALSAHDITRELCRRNVSLYAVDLMPRTTRAQSMDALSSQANLVGFKSVILAAAALGKILPLLMTPAGTIKPARVLVVGAGVAGLQAIATAKRLGAVVNALDVRPAVKEEVESLGAQFIALPIDTSNAQDDSGYARAQSDEQLTKQRELMARVVAESDIVISTAAVPGKRAPILITRAMVQDMAPGSVIVDVSAERGGNCELTRPGQTIEHAGVTIIGDDNLAASVPFHASQMYSNNLVSFLKYLLHEGRLRTDRTDEIVAGTLVCHEGHIVNDAVRLRMGLASPDPPAGAGF